MFKKKNIPNLITIFRIILVPIILTLLIILIVSDKEKWTYIGEEGSNYRVPILLLIAGVIFIIASISDFADGYIARKYNYVSDFGKFFDPIADKVLINSVLITFIPLKILPFWIPLLLILRDTIIDFLRMILSSKQVTLSADIFGKLKTIFQMIGLSILFFLFCYVCVDNKINSSIQNMSFIKYIILIPIYVATLFSIWSGIVYFFKSWKQLF